MARSRIAPVTFLTKLTRYKAGDFLDANTNQYKAAVINNPTTIFTDLIDQLSITTWSL
jgi:hypothetical protein